MILDGIILHGSYMDPTQILHHSYMDPTRINSHMVLHGSDPTLLLQNWTKKALYTKAYFGLVGGIKTQLTADS